MATITRQEAMQEFARLVSLHGLQWVAGRNIPQTDWERMQEINTVLDTNDRREAIGLPRTGRA
jgi:hypothetical protein